MAEAPLISIITASFNALEGLKATVASVAAQSFRSVEHIVIDGGSNDGTVEYLQSLGDTVRWISEPDKGIADGLNKGVAIARGEWILILQAEDHLVDYQSLTRVVEKLTDSDLVSCGVIVVENGKTRHVPGRGFDWKSRLFMTMPHQGLLARRALFQRIGTFNTTYKIAMDYEWLLRGRREGVKTSVVDLPLSVMPATGISSRRDWPGMRARLREFRKAQISASSNLAHKLALCAFWLAYEPFKRFKLCVTK